MLFLSTYRNDFNDSRRGYQSSFSRGLGDALSRSGSSMGMESGSDYRSSSSMTFVRDRRARESDASIGGSSGDGNKRLFVKNVSRVWWTMRYLSLLQYLQVCHDCSSYVCVCGDSYWDAVMVSTSVHCPIINSSVSSVLVRCPCLVCLFFQ